MVGFSQLVTPRRFAYIMLSPPHAVSHCPLCADGVDWGLRYGALPYALGALEAQALTVMVSADNLPCSSSGYGGAPDEQNAGRGCAASRGAAALLPVFPRACFSRRRRASAPPGPTARSPSSR